MKIWENFKTLPDAVIILRKKNCWSCCDQCKSLWSNIETEHVHMTIREVQKQKVTRFVCDDCLTIVKSKIND